MSYSGGSRPGRLPIVVNIPTSSNEAVGMLKDQRLAVDDMKRLVLVRCKTLESCCSKSFPEGCTRDASHDISFVAN